MSNTKGLFERKLEYAARAACRALGIDPDARSEIGGVTDSRAVWEGQAEFLRPIIAAIDASQDFDWDVRTGGGSAAQLDFHEPSETVRGRS
jgi:hypothetical protein